MTLLPPAAELGEAAAAPEPLSVSPDSNEEIPASAGEPPRGGGRITVERGGRGASIEISSNDLDVGLIIGRADKCTDRGIRAVLNEWVSRAHLLILREGDKIHAFDLCSMNGTYRDGRTIRHVTLSEQGLVLHLGSATGVALRWQGGRKSSQRSAVSVQPDSPLP